MSCTTMQIPHCVRHPQAARSLNSYDYAQSLQTYIYEALAITHLYMLVEAEGRKHSSVKDDEPEEGKETIDGGNAINNPEMAQRYQLSNNIESATLELDENAQIISYEEYYPYGDTSYQAGRSVAEVGMKRYRYTGKEKDEESGLYYMLARYYSGWLGRWTAADPAGLVDGVNLYAYCRGNPVVLVDPDGTRVDEGKLIDIETINVIGQSEGNVVNSKMDYLGGQQGGAVGEFDETVSRVSEREIPIYLYINGQKASGVIRIDKEMEFPEVAVDNWKQIPFSNMQDILSENENLDEYTNNKSPKHGMNIEEAWKFAADSTLKVVGLMPSSGPSGIIKNFPRLAGKIASSGGPLKFIRSLFSKEANVPPPVTTKGVIGAKSPVEIKTGIDPKEIAKDMILKIPPEADSTSKEKYRRK